MADSFKQNVIDATQEHVRNLVRKILESEDYLRNLRRRAIAGVLPPAVEQMLWHYLYGKPADTIKVNVSDESDLFKLSNAELAKRATELAEITLVDKEEKLN